MFGWLTKMLLQTPVQNSCSCCEGKREKLEKMRREIENGTIETANPQMPDDVILNCDTPEHEYTGKVLGYMISGPYQIKVDGQLPTDVSLSDERDSCCCGENENNCCGKCKK